MNDKLKQAQKHLNNARTYVKDALGKTRRELEEKIGEQQSRLDGDTSTVVRHATQRIGLNAA
ncbi:MAG: hypothetical protein ACRERX_11450 [Pseudomonas sp.]